MPGSHPAVEVTRRYVRDLRAVFESSNGPALDIRAAVELSDALQSLGWLLADFANDATQTTAGRGWQGTLKPANAQGLAEASRGLARAARNFGPARQAG